MLSIGVGNEKWSDGCLLMEQAADKGDANAKAFIAASKVSLA